MKNRKQWIVIVIVLLLSVLFGYGNVITKKGGILDDSLLDKDNYFYRTDQAVKSFVKDGLNTGDTIAVIINFPDGLQLSDLAYIKKVTDDMLEHFPEAGVLSLSVAANYVDTGEEILSDSYINEDLLAQIDSFDLEAWKERIRQDLGVYGVLIGQNFDYAQVVLFFPVGYDEIEVFHRMTELLEQRRIYWLEWFIKSDIFPVDEYENVTLSGWTIARGLMDAALLTDVLKLSTVGLVIVTLFFWLSLKSFKQAVIASSIILISFVWIRGTIGILQWLDVLFWGRPIYERVYLLLVYTALIVAGISFGERKFDAYNEKRKEMPHASRSEVWGKAKGINGNIFIVALIAIVNFIFLYQISMRGIMEVGILSAIGLVMLYGLVVFFIPTLHVFWGGEAIKEPSSRFDQVIFTWNRLLDGVINGCYRIVTTLSPRASAIVAFLLVIIVFGTPAGFIARDFAKGEFKFIEVKTKPLEYLPGTIVYRASQILNKPGNYGFGRLQFLIQSVESGVSVDDVGFLKSAFDFQQESAKLPGVRTARSILDTVRVVSRETYGKIFPTSEQEAHDILTTIEWDLGDMLKEQLWFDRGIIMYTSVAADDSNALSDLTHAVVNLAQLFPDLEILPFGKLVIYPESDRYIREGKPKNVFTSFWIVVVICALWVLYRNKKFGFSEMQLGWWQTGLIMVMPFVFAIGGITLIMRYFHIPLDQSNACILSLAVNAAIDFNLYLVADYSYALSKNFDPLEYAVKKRGKVILIDGVLNCLCFVPLMTSQFLPIQRLGWVMIVMLILCEIGALIVMPSMLTYCVKRRK